MYPATILICSEVLMDNVPDEIVCRFRIGCGHIVPQLPPFLSYKPQLLPSFATATLILSKHLSLPSTAIVLKSGGVAVRPVTAVLSAPNS